MALRRVAAGPLSRSLELLSRRSPPSLTASLVLGRAAAPSLAPRFYGEAGRLISIRGHSTGPGGSPSSTFVGWLKEMGKKYNKKAGEFTEVVTAGKSIWAVTTTVLGGFLLYVDFRMDSKINKRLGEFNTVLGEESARRELFQRTAVRDFQDHVSKTQSGLNNLHEKLLKCREDGMENRHQVMTAAKFLEVNGYMVVSSDEFKDVLQKVNELDNRTLLGKGGPVTHADKSPLGEEIPTDSAGRSFPTAISQTKSPLGEEIPTDSAGRSFPTAVSQTKVGAAGTDDKSVGDVP